MTFEPDDPFLPLTTPRVEGETCSPWATAFVAAVLLLVILALCVNSSAT